MKVIIALALFVAVASAYIQQDKVQYGLDGVNCFEDRVLACRNFMGSNYASFDCEGECGLCSLCNAATDAIVPGCAHCKDGIQACVDTCNAGKKVCSACAKYL